MPITVSLDEMLYQRRMTLTELSDAVDITLANLSILKNGEGEGDPLYDAGGDLPGARLPAGRSVAGCRQH